jgi:porphobilinogen synthase
VKETDLNIRQIVYPIFVIEGKNIRKEIPSMPGQYQYSVDWLPQILDQCASKRVQNLILFGIPEEKDSVGSSSWNEKGVIQRALLEIKRQYTNFLVITDICLCEYTDHGHCGVIENGQVDNDKTLPLLEKQVLSHVNAGADMVAPSGMMDGMVKAIRSALDRNGFTHIPIMSYAVKYASAFYGPFREAAESTPTFGDRKSYQMDFCNVQEGIWEATLDFEEGADILMVKPAMAYLDIICHLHDQFNLPVAAYNVSGEYAMVKAAAQKGWIDESQVVMEMLLSIRRAGARIIITYFALDVADML